MPVSWADITLAFEFVSASDTEHRVFLCKRTSKLYWQSGTFDDLDKMPDDIDDDQKYVQIPDKRARSWQTARPGLERQFLAHDLDEIRRMSGEGALTRNLRPCWSQGRN
jgi:hypothetical protein